MSKKLNVGVVGATGLVGEVFMRLLTERKFPVSELRPFASEKSEGLKLNSCGQVWSVETLHENAFKNLDLVFFSSGDDISKEWAPIAVQAGAFAIDNSAAFRMDPDAPLVVPEVNSHQLPPQSQPRIIANPNCSTIQLVVALKPLVKFGLRDVKVATYQAVSGAGKPGPEELLAQSREHLDSGQILKNKPKAFAHEIAFNCIPQIGSFNDDGFCSEEVKIVNETKKILELPDLRVSAFTVRVPVLNAHSEAVWVTLDQDISQTEMEGALRDAEGLIFVPHSQPSEYPTPKAISNENPVYVGRVHRDPSDPHTWLMWVVADNVLKGAALNGIQIAEKIFGVNSN